MIPILILAFVLVPVRIKYQGGGDWYNDPDILPNLMSEVRSRVADVETADSQLVLSFDDDRIFQYPFLFLTGHGNVRFSRSEVNNIRKYVKRGGFIYIDDDYGMDKFIRRELKRVFPDKKLVLVPFSHPLFHMFYNFSKGAPKIHEHYKGPPGVFGIFINGKLRVLYTYNTNISDGWTPNHNDPAYKREKAFQFGTNIILYSLLY